MDPKKFTVYPKKVVLKQSQFKLFAIEISKSMLTHFNNRKAEGNRILYRNSTFYQPENGCKAINS